MLVLSRYRDESIYIGDDIIITIVDVRGDRVRLGIQAPPNVSVHRQEIYDAIAREKDVRKSEGQVKTERTKTTGLSQHRGKGLPVDIDTPPVGFGGIPDVVSE